MCRIVLINLMTLSKKYSTSIIASIVVAVLAIGISFQGSTAQTPEFDYRNSAVNNMQFRTTFHFVGLGELELETFSVYKQLGGFKKGETAAFRIAGLAGIDKIGLYKLSDLNANQRFASQHDPINNIDIDVEVIQNDLVLHQFKYAGCKLTDYRVDTLFDADETYSGKTKFAIVDIFEFRCDGYHPNTPLFEKAVQHIQRAKTTNTMDLVPGATWKTHPKFQGSTP